MKNYYTAVASNTGGRDGKITTPDGVLNLDVATPVEMGGQTPGKTNSEQLFAAGYSACFNGALNQILRKSNIEHGETRVTAWVSLLEDPADKGFMLAVKLQIVIEGLGSEAARKYAELAHHMCPYSKAISGQVDVTLEVV
jgi:Ohr subfamily peroxiredoxin